MVDLLRNNHFRDESQNILKANACYQKLFTKGKMTKSYLYIQIIANTDRLEAKTN